MTYAFKQALIRIYGPGNNFLTIYSHIARFKRFAKWLEEYDGTKDARRINQDHLVKYTRYLAEQDLQVSYAVNRLSSVNVAMHAFRGDKEVWLSPSKFIGKRSYICTTEAAGDWEQMSAACDLLISKNNHRAAAIIRLARTFGMRLREACKADLKRIKKEFDTHGKARILEGTKGGRKADDRTILLSTDTLPALEFALKVKPLDSRNLISDEESYKQFISKVVTPARSPLKEVGISSFKELRARFAQDLYQELTAQPLPLKCLPKDKEADKLARQEISRALGHAREDAAKSYVGGKR